MKLQRTFDSHFISFESSSVYFSWCSDNSRCFTCASSAYQIGFIKCKVFIIYLPPVFQDGFLLNWTDTDKSFCKFCTNTLKLNWIFYLQTSPSKMLLLHRVRQFLPISLNSKQGLTQSMFHCNMWIHSSWKNNWKQMETPSTTFVVPPLYSKPDQVLQLNANIWLKK